MNMNDKNINKNKNNYTIVPYVIINEYYGQPRERRSSQIELIITEKRRIENIDILQHSHSNLNPNHNNKKTIEINSDNEYFIDEIKFDEPKFDEPKFDESIYQQLHEQLKRKNITNVDNSTDQFLDKTILNEIKPKEIKPKEIKPKEQSDTFVDDVLMLGGVVVGTFLGFYIQME